MVIGTVKGDLHDIGKDLVVSLLVGGGIGVCDLGVDVPKENFVHAVEKGEAGVVGLSALLSTTIMYTRDVLGALEDAGSRDEVKIIVGGAAASQEIADRYGADAYAEDAISGVRIIRDWLDQR